MDKKRKRKNTVTISEAVVYSVNPSDVIVIPQGAEVK
jgi:hypothetical protein